jgi:hypothetical protein
LALPNGENAREEERAGLRAAQEDLICLIDALLASFEKLGPV